MEGRGEEELRADFVCDLLTIILFNVDGGDAFLGELVEM